MATYRVRVGEDWAEVDLPETDGEILAVPIVSALVFRNESRGELVLQRRDDGGPADGLWELPGGGWLAGEPPTEALARELMEETGLELNHADAGEKRSEAQPGRPFVASAPMVVSVGVEGAYPILHVVYVCFADGEPRGAEGESREPAWFSVAHVKAMLEDPPLFTGPTYAALTAYFDS
jgi:8-oxo-dGTP pyrophosphatase MutT (NUDIX family)